MSRVNDGRMPGWVWGVFLGCVVGSCALLGLLWLQESGSPPPARPLRITAAADELPPPAPAKPPPAVVSPPPPQPSNPVAEQRQAVSDDSPEPQADDPVVDKVVERPEPPKLRRRDPGIAPKRLVRRSTGKSAGKGVANLLLVATYQGSPVAAPVEIDGVWRGNTPLAVTIKAGSHLIRVDHGRTRVNQFVTNLLGGRSVRLEVELRSPAEAKGNGPSSYGKAHHH